MRDNTKIIKELYRLDFVRITATNNAKDRRRAESERLQSKEDKRKFYRLKWEAIKANAETAAGRGYCQRLLDVIERI